MLSLLARSALKPFSATRAYSATAVVAHRLSPGETSHVTVTSKLARRGPDVEWATLDDAVSNKSEKMRNEKQQQSGPRSVAETWADLSDKAVARLGPPPGKYAGRSVEVQKGDLAGALRRLNGILFENRVHAERVRNLRHEKKGYKRRRLASERWRRRFAHEVRTKVELVKTIRRRGA